MNIKVFNVMSRTRETRHASFHKTCACKCGLNASKIPEALIKYWVGVQRGQSYLMGRRCLFSLGWPPF